MDLETRKTELVERIEAERRSLENNFAVLADTDLLLPGVSGDWSIKDILAHLADWEQRFLGWYDSGRQNEGPMVPAPGLAWGDIDLLNQMIYEKHYPRPLDEILEEFRSSFLEVFAAVQGMSPLELFEPGYYAWTGNATLASFAAAYTANHYRWAKNLIRRWIKDQNHDRGRTLV